MRLEALALGILALDRAESGWGCEEAPDVVLGNHTPEGSGVGSADGLAFEHYGGVSMYQRSVADIAVADDPADIRGSPEDLSRLHVVYVSHRPVQRNEMAACRADNALGLAGGAGSIQNIRRVIAFHMDAGSRAGVFLCRMPIEVAAVGNPRFRLGALENQREFRLVGSHFNGSVEQWLVFHDAAGLDAARRGENRLGLGIVDADSKLARCKTSKDD